MRHFEHIPLIGLTVSSQFIHKMAAINGFWQIEVMLGVNIIHGQFSIRLVKSFNEGGKSDHIIAVVDILEVAEEISIGLEMAGNERRVHFYPFSVRTEEHPIVKLVLPQRVLEDLLAACSLDFVVKLEDVDVVQIVKILSIEPSKGDHTATDKTSGVPSTRFRMIQDISSYFKTLERVISHVDYEQIVEIIAKPTRENVDFIIIDHTRMPPAGKERSAFQLPLHPFKIFRRVGLH